jgi:hypothetical protein
MYLFYSSDISTLFKKDVLSAISLPEDYSVHFRYPKENLQDDFIKKLGGMLEKEGVIVYVSGNDHTKKEEDREIKFFPIRNVRVKDVYIDDPTGMVHFHLKLGPIIDSNDIPLQETGNKDKSLPPYNFIKHQTRWSSSICKWHKKVESLVDFDNNFKDFLFFNINLRHSEKYYNCQVEVAYDSIESASIFKLHEDKNYLLDIAVYNSSADKNKFEDFSIKIEYDTDDFFITNPERIVIGAVSDYRKFKIITRDIKTKSSSAYLKLISYKNDGSTDTVRYEELIRLDIKRSSTKLYKFIFISLFGVFGTSMLALSVSQLNKVNANTSFFIPLLVLALISLMISATGQFHYFNKRN